MSCDAGLGRGFQPHFHQHHTVRRHLVYMRVIRDRYQANLLVLSRVITDIRMSRMMSSVFSVMSVNRAYSSH